MAGVVTDPGTYPTAGILTEQVMSSYDILKPQHIQTLMARYGEQYMPMFEVLRSMGREFPIAGDEWYVHEENRYHRALEFDSQVDPSGPGATSVITLANDTGAYPRIGDIITYPNEVQAVVLDLNRTAGTITVAPSDVLVTLPTPTAGDLLGITSGVFGAGTDQPEGTTLGSTKREFIAQIIKETVGAEGSQLVNEYWYKVTDNNKNVIGWYTPGTLRGEYLTSLKIDGAITWGKPNANPDELIATAGLPGAGNELKMTKGMFPWMRDLAYENEFDIDAGTSAIKLTDLDAMGLYLKTQGVTSGFALFMVGPQLGSYVENGAFDYIDGNGTDYTRVEKTIFKGDRELSLAVNFSTLKKGGVTYIMKTMDQWANPTTTPSTDYTATEMGMVIPLTQYKDPESNIMVKNLGIGYRAYNGYSRKMEIWNVAGAGGGRYVSSIDSKNTFLRSHLGLQFTHVNQTILATCSHS